MCCYDHCLLKENELLSHFIIFPSGPFRTVEFVSFLILARGSFYRYWLLRQSVASALNGCR